MVREGRLPRGPACGFPAELGRIDRIQDGGPVVHLVVGGPPMRQLLAVLVLALATAAPALADGLIVVPRSPPDMPHLRNVPLWVRSHAVTVKIEDRVAVTEVDQVFVNP